MATILHPEGADLAADARREAQDLHRAIEAYSRVAAQARTASTVDEVLHVAAREAGALVGVGRCSAYLRDEAAGVFRGVVGQAGDVCLDPDIKRSTAGGPADGVTQELLRTGRPVIVPNADEDPRTVKSSVRFWRIRSIMAVPMPFGGEVIGLLFLDDEDRAHDFTPQDAQAAVVFAGLAAGAVLHVQGRVDLRSQLDAAGRQLVALRRASAVDERLSQLVLDGRSLPEVLATLAELLGKPCAVFDPDGRRLAAAAAPGASAEEVAVHLLEPDVAQRPEIAEALEAHAGSRAFVVGPLPAAGVLHRHVVAPVLLGDEVWGRLVVMEHKRRFTGGDVLAVRRAATVVALQVGAERRAAEADWNAGASLAAELLTCSPDGELVARRADRLGVRLDVPRVVVVLGTRSGSEEDLPDPAALSAALVRAGLAALVAPAGGTVAALVELPDESDPAPFVSGLRAEAEALRRDLRRGEELVAGVSSVHAGRAGLRAAHQEARQVAECIRRFTPPGGEATATADELGAGRLFLATSDPDLVTGFADETFGALVRDPGKGDLLVTLCTFFDHMASIRRSAATMGLHENTIRYRLARIEEITGLAISHDPDAQLRARLSLLVLHLQGRLRAPDGRALLPS
jgi:GAF domain-containing protein